MIPPCPLPPPIGKGTFATRLYPSFVTKHALTRLNRLIDRRGLMPVLQSIGYTRCCRHLDGEAQLILCAARRKEEQQEKQAYANKKKQKKRRR